MSERGRVKDREGLGWTSAPRIPGEWIWDGTVALGLMYVDHVLLPGGGISWWVLLGIKCGGGSDGLKLTDGEWTTW
jgi:hypothetical protein